MTDNPLLVQMIFLTAGADPTKLAQWMDHNIPATDTDQAIRPEGFTPHAA